MADYNSERDRSANAFTEKFLDTTKLPASYNIHQGKKIIKKITAILSETYNQSNKDDSMANTFLLNPKGTYDRKVPKYTDFITLYQRSSTMEFSFTQL